MPTELIVHFYGDRYNYRSDALVVGNGLIVMPYRSVADFCPPYISMAELIDMIETSTEEILSDWL